MNKVTKASVAAGAAAALLLGGAGTYALWNDTADLTAGTVSTGHLTLDATAAGTWADISADAANTTFAPTTDKLVPGDTVTFTQTVTIAADGKNLKGDLLVGGLGGGTAELPAGLSVAVLPVVAPEEDGLSVAGSTVSFTAPGTYDVDVEVTVAFDSAETASMDEAIDLGQLTLTLNQVR